MINGSLVSVVIPCLNEANHLRALLDALRAEDTPLHEIIVVDNGSTDGSPGVVNEYRARHPGWPLRLLTCLTPGAAAAMNVGIRASSGDVIVRIDGHCLPHADYVRRLVGRLQGEGVGVTGGVWEVAPGRDSKVARAIATALTHRLATGGATYRHPQHLTEPTAVDTVPFGCYRKSLWHDLGGYDERLQVNEDYVLNYKARLAGWSVILDPTIRSTYFAREDLGKLADQYYKYGWRKAEMVKAFPKSVRLRQIIPGGFVATLLGLAVLGVLAPAAWQILAVLLALYGLTLTAAACQLAAAHRTWATIPAYIAAFATIQLSWGAGACVNVLTFGRQARRQPQPSSPALLR